MAVLDCRFYSEVLEVTTSMTVVLPDAPQSPEPPVLHLLHGLSDDGSAWQRYTSILDAPDRGAPRRGQLALPGLRAA